MNAFSKSIEMLLEMQRIQLLEGDVWVTDEDKSTEDIGAKISRESKLSPGMVAYILTKEASV
jgi:hypothetical protein